MRIEKQLQVPADVLYDKIISSVIFDIRKATGKDLTLNQLENFDYIKEFSSSNRAKITIEKVIKNQTYQFKTATTKNEFVARYDIEDLGDQTCRVTYIETMESFGLMQRLNDMLLGTMLGHFKKKQFKKMLEMMEESY